MKILFYKWDSICEDDMQAAMLSSGIYVEDFKYQISDYISDVKFMETLQKLLAKNNFDCVFSFDYYPVISEVCEILGLPYVSYMVDSPHLTLFCNNIYNKCNYIFVFDSVIYKLLYEKGISNVFYLPLAVNTKRIDKIVSMDKKYSSDISFVGSLYKSNNFFDKLGYLPEYLLGYLEGVMISQKNIYGKNILLEVLDDDIMEKIKKYAKFCLGDDYWASDKLVFSSMFLSQKITNIERTEIARLLSEKLQFNLYTNEDTKEFPYIINKGAVDYYSQMPQVFFNSKINLNITLRSIEKGIPLRVMDIMGSKGFLLTNYQEDMLEYFEPGKDFVYYESYEDLVKKAKYYIENDNDRNQIAKNGYNKIKEFHSYEIRVKQIFSKI